MSQEFGPIAPMPAAASLPWSEVWMSALTRPSVETFEGLVRDPNASANRAYTWIFISTLISYAISIAAQLALRGVSSLGSQVESEVVTLLSSSLIALICGAPVAALLSVLGLMIRAGITQFIAGVLGGTGTYSRLVYAVAAYSAPLSLIASIISAIPVVNCLAFPLGIYAMVLDVIAVKAVNQFGWGKAIASSIFILAGILVLVAVVAIVILALLGPTIGNVFSNMLQEIGTPAP